MVAALLRMGTTDRCASIVLAWLLAPGASLSAGRLRNLVDAIDEVVAGQLWIQICEHDASDDTYVAKKILTRVEREAKAELGVGDLAERRDPTWAAAMLVELSRSPTLYTSRTPAERLQITSGKFTANAVWLALAVMAHNLGRAVGRLGGPDLDTATSATLQRKVFTVPGRRVRSGRRLTLRLPQSWPWKVAIEQALTKIHAIPLRC